MIRRRDKSRWASSIMSYPVLTECVEILDGHTINKRFPSDGIQLRSASGGLARRRNNATTTLERRVNTAENERNDPSKSSSMAVYAGRK